MTKRRNGTWLAFLQDAAKATTNECVEGGGRARPQVHVGGVGMNASRYVWIVANGDPGAFYVLHTCDNNLCVNIRHLYLGDQTQNIRDAYDRNRRGTRGYRRGAEVMMSKLTEAKVLDIRSRNMPNETALGREFGVSQSAISQVLLRKTWRHI